MITRSRHGIKCEDDLGPDVVIQLFGLGFDTLKPNLIGNESSTETRNWAEWTPLDQFSRLVSKKTYMKKYYSSPRSNDLYTCIDLCLKTSCSFYLMCIVSLSKLCKGLKWA